MKNSLFRLSGVGELFVGVSTRTGSKPHFHDGYSIAVFHAPARIWCRGRIHAVGLDEFVVLEPGEVHGGQGDAGDCLQDGLIIDPALLEAMFGTKLPARFATPIVCASSLRREISIGLLRANPQKIKASVRELFVRHGVRHVELPAQREQQSPNCTTDRTVAAQADAAQMSRFHYSRKVRATIGLSPRDYRRLQRVQRARLLIEQGHALADSAAEAGFSDQAHMTRQMRQILGVTPGSLRETPR